MKMLLALLFVSLSANAFNVNWSIYGNDDRLDLSRTSSKQRKLADSTAAMIVNSFLVKKTKTYKIDAPTLEELAGVCREERFREQPAASTCSGTLIADDLILTAAHCYSNQAICKQASWVFGFHEDPKNRYEIPEQEVYQCQSIVYKELDVKNGKDFAVIKLDRKVKNHRPVKISQVYDPAKLPANTSLMVIGHPKGLPTKIAANGQIISVNGNILMTNLDTFTGNSGSGVFNTDTQELLGVLSFGKEDYKEDEQRTCFTSEVYRMEDGGEAVMSIGPVKEFLMLYQNTRP